MPDGIPVITLRVEGMKFQIMHALHEYEAELAEETRKAVDAFCTPENIQQVVDREIHSAMTSVIREEIDRFFRRGDGRRVIATLVEEKLRREYG